MKRKSIRLCMSALIATIIFAIPAFARTDVRPAVQASVHVALILAVKGNFKAAMTKVRESGAVHNMTPDETRMISVVERVMSKDSGLRPSQP